MFKYVVMFYIFTSYKHDHDVQVMMFKFYVQIYDHEACHLIKQVITKLKAVSYRPFSLCRPKGIKETVFHVIYVFALLTEDLLPSLTIGWARSTRYVHHDEDPLRRSKPC